jgi:hypothetical protein
MARKSPSRLDKRREAEAVEAREKDSPTKKSTRKKATKRKATPRKKKVKAVARERLVWAVFGGNMKEEARFPYDQRAEADAKVEQLRSKGKKLYFVQPIKEAIEGPAPRAGGDDGEEE